MPHRSRVTGSRPCGNPENLCMPARREWYRLASDTAAALELSELCSRSGSGNRAISSADESLVFGGRVANSMAGESEKPGDDLVVVAAADFLAGPSEMAVDRWFTTTHAVHDFLGLETLSHKHDRFGLAF